MTYGLIYEISYNAKISGNIFIRNGIGTGPKNRGFPTSAIYISESGSDSRVPGPVRRDFRDHRQHVHQQLGRRHPLGEL